MSLESFPTLRSRISLSLLCLHWIIWGFLFRRFYTLSPLSFPLDSVLNHVPFLCLSQKWSQCLNQKWLSGNLQWLRRRATSALNYVVKGSSAITMQHVQIIATFTCKPVFPVSMSEDATPLTWSGHQEPRASLSSGHPISHFVFWTLLPRHFSNPSTSFQLCCQESLPTCHHLSPKHGRCSIYICWVKYHFRWPQAHYQAVRSSFRGQPVLQKSMWFFWKMALEAQQSGVGSATALHVVWPSG